MIKYYSYSVLRDFIILNSISIQYLVSSKTRHAILFVFCLPAGAGQEPVEPAEVPGEPAQPGGRRGHEEARAGEQGRHGEHHKLTLSSM